MSVIKYRNSLTDEWQDLIAIKGADGHTPVRGVDYWTEADQQAIVNAVLASLANGEEVAY